MAKVNFISTVLAKYTGLAARDADTLYFLEDVKKIYKGDVDVTEAISVVAKFDEVPGADIVEGKLYLNAATFEVRVKNGDAWATMLPGIIATSDEFTDENAAKLATIGATKEYVIAEIQKITDGTAFVKGLEWKDGALYVDNGDGEPDPIELTGVAHEPTYDSASLTLTIPVYGKEDVVINIPKDNFVRTGRYEKDYDLGDGKTGPALVLVVNDGTEADGTEVVIPAASLVDVYTGETTQSIKVTVSDDNKIAAEVSIDASAGNALVLTENGLMVDINGKANKLTSDAEGHILVGSEDGDLADSGLILKTEGEMGDSATEVPVAALITAAIAAAVKTAQDTIAEQLSEITNEEGTGRLDVLEDTVNNIKESIVGEGEADEILVSTKSGIARSGAKIGGETLSEEADANTLATEAAIVDALSWKSI